MKIVSIFVSYSPSWARRPWSRPDVPTDPSAISVLTRKLLSVNYIRCSVDPTISSAVAYTQAQQNGFDGQACQEIGVPLVDSCWPSSFSGAECALLTNTAPAACSDAPGRIRLRLSGTPRRPARSRVDRHLVRMPNGRAPSRQGRPKSR